MQLPNPNVQQENSEKLRLVNLKLKNTFYVSCKYILKVYLIFPQIFFHRIFK